MVTKFCLIIPFASAALRAIVQISLSHRLLNVLAVRLRGAPSEAGPAEHVPQGLGGARTRAQQSVHKPVQTPLLEAQCEDLVHVASCVRLGGGVDALRQEAVLGA